MPLSKRHTPEAHLKVEVTSVDELTRDLTIEVPKDRVDGETEKRFLELQKHAEIKGFRKGKVPMHIIKSTYAGEVQADVIDALIKETYPAALKENPLKVATQPEVTDLKITDDGGLAYTARVQLWPEIEAVETDGLKVYTIDLETTDDEVEQAVTNLQERFAEYRELSRPATETDTVTADMTKLFDSKSVIDQTEFPGSRIDLANPNTIKELREELVGMSAGDDKEVTVRYADDYSDPKFAGAELRYRVAVTKVEEKIIPEVNDAFARQVRIGETALEMKMKIREDIKNHKETDLRRAQKRQLVGQIVDKNKIAIPDNLIDHYLSSLVEDQMKNNPELDEGAFRAEQRPIAEATFRWDLLWRELADREKLEVTPQDVDRWLQEFAARQGITPEQATEALKRDGRLERLRESMAEEKVLEWLLDKAATEPAPKA